MKNGSLLAADFKADQLPAGPAGATGATGPEGPAGRSALSSLQEGETVRGYFGGDFHTTAGGSDWRVFVSFPIPASTAPSTIFLDGITPAETCTGTANNPTAPAGVLCVYVIAAQNPAEAVDTHTFDSFAALGFHVLWTASNAGDTYYRASYAYTQGPIV